MGGCCCCSSRRLDVNNAPAYYYYPRGTEERVPLSSHQRTSSAISTGVLVDTNLETSSPDAYIPPRLPLPFDVALGYPQTTQTSPDACVANSDITTQETVGSDANVIQARFQDKETDCKPQTDIDLGPAKEMDTEFSKKIKDVFSPEEEEDGCPICLEEYETENPKLTTKCEHDFHLACILEWMERSETCPVCDKEMEFDSPLD